MDKLKSLFPFSFKTANVKELIIAIIIYIVIGFVGGLIISLLSLIPLVGIILGIIGWIIEIYVLAGIILAVLNFLGVLNK